jgi:hypothetical protein
LCERILGNSEEQLLKLPTKVVYTEGVLIAVFPELDGSFSAYMPPTIMKHITIPRIQPPFLSSAQSERSTGKSGMQIDKEDNGDGDSNASTPSSSSSLSSTSSRSSSSSSSSSSSLSSNSSFFSSDSCADSSDSHSSTSRASDCLKRKGPPFSLVTLSTLLWSLHSNSVYNCQAVVVDLLVAFLPRRKIS